MNIMALEKSSAEASRFYLLEFCRLSVESTISYTSFKLNNYVLSISTSDTFLETWENSRIWYLPQRCWWYRWGRQIEIHTIKDSKKCIPGPRKCQPANNDIAGFLWALLLSVMTKQQWLFLCLQSDNSGKVKRLEIASEAQELHLYF